MIISILGMSGKDRDKKEKTTAFYDCEVLGKKSGDYHNATDMLLENYDGEFYFLGTHTAIEFQKELLEYPEDKTYFIEIEDNSLDDIFEKVYELILKAKEEVILDITHGFRHQPISAIFSATLHRFLNDSDLKIIFAKQVIEFIEYEYILLNEYIDITQLSLLLTGFIRTLNFIDSIKIEGFETLPFANFSKALLSNDFLTLEKSYKNLIATIKIAKKDKRFDHLGELFNQVENSLSVFSDFETMPIYQKYLTISKLLFEKNYILLSLTYLFESLRFYCSNSFEKNNITCKREKRKSNSYNINQEVITFVTQKDIYEYRPNCYDKNFKNLYQSNKKLFYKIAKEYKELRELRNNLTHVNSTKHSPDIKTKLQNLIENITKIVDDNLLYELSVVPKKRIVKNFHKKI